MKKVLQKLQVYIICLVLAASCVPAGGQTQVYAADAKVKLIYGDSKLKDKDAYVITILAEGFTSSEQGSFQTEAKNLADTFLNCSPWDELKSVVKIYAVGTVSKESGCKGDKATSYQAMESDSRDTCYSAQYWYGGTERLLAITDYTAAEDAVSKYKPQTDVPIVLVNSTKYGGSGGPISVASINSLSSEIVLHELGHTIAGLADEYYWQTREAPNLTSESSKKKVKWKDFVGKNGIGIYPYEGTTDWYVPSEHCKMKTLNTEFCEVCKEEIRKAVCENSNKTVLYYQPYAKDNNSYDGELDFCKFLVLRRGNSATTGDAVEKALKITCYDASGNKLDGFPQAAGQYSAKIAFSGSGEFEACEQYITFGVDHSYQLVKATGTDYTATCSDCGKRITKKVAVPAMSGLKGAEKGFSLKIKTAESFADGVELQYSKDKGFKDGAKTKVIKNHRSEKVSVGKLKAKTTYYVRVRAYHKAGGKKIYSEWSGVKTVKTK